MEAFRTHSTPLAAVLLHKQFRLIDLERQPDSKRVEFLFESSTELQEIVKAFWKAELTCPARPLFAAYREAQNLVHNYHI